MSELRGFGAQIYATQKEGGIKGDGRVGIDFKDGDFTVSEIHVLIDRLQYLANLMQSDEPKARRVDIRFE